jgi:hypothetical protein
MHFDVACTVVLIGYNLNLIQLLFAAWKRNSTRAEGDYVVVMADFRLQNPIQLLFALIALVNLNTVGTALMKVVGHDYCHLASVKNLWLTFFLHFSSVNRCFPLADRQSREGLMRIR